MDHVAGPERSRAIEQLGRNPGAADAGQIAAAMRAAHVDRAEAIRIGETAAATVDLALAARLAGVGSAERALRQADRLLPREHADGVFEVRSLEPGEAHVLYRASSRVDPLLCAARAGLLSGLPSCFGAARARVEEVECASAGAEACCYRVRWSRDIADRPLLQTLAVGALVGVGIGLIGWIVSLFSPSASLALYGAVGIAAAAWRVESSRGQRTGHREGVIAELETRIAERMDDLAKLDGSTVRREATDGPVRLPQPDLASEHAAELQREVAAFARELAALRIRAQADPGGETGSVEESLGAIGERFEQLRGLADGLVRVGAPGGERRQREDLSAVLGYIVQRARRADGSGPEIALEVPADLPFVHCDAVQIERALAQLLETACDAAGPNGRVEVAAVAVEEGVELIVRDDGADADPDRMEEAFDPFFGETLEVRADADGLRLAAAILADHGSALQLHAESEAGTRASFVLSSESPTANR